MPIEATFEVTSWDEEPFDDGVGVSKLTRAVVAKEYAGDITGTSTTEWLMAYEPDCRVAGHPSRVSRGFPHSW